MHMSEFVSIGSVPPIQIILQLDLILSTAYSELIDAGWQMLSMYCISLIPFSTSPASTCACIYVYHRVIDDSVSRGWETTNMWLHSIVGSTVERSCSLPADALRRTRHCWVADGQATWSAPTMLLRSCYADATQKLIHAHIVWISGVPFC